MNRCIIDIREFYETNIYIYILIAHIFIGTNLFINLHIFDKFVCKPFRKIFFYYIFRHLKVWELFWAVILFESAGHVQILCHKQVKESEKMKLHKSLHFRILCSMSQKFIVNKVFYFTVEIRGVTFKRNYNPK